MAVLGQSRPANTTAVSIYSPAQNERATIEKVVVCNTTAASHAFRIFLDDDGTTYDETTALYFDQALAANTTLEIDTQWSMTNPSGNLAVRTDTNDAFTFTVMGQVDSA